MYWKEYVFGVFIYLITLLTFALLVASVVLNLPTLVVVLMIGLGCAFYVFSFVDLVRVVKRVQNKVHRSTRVAIIMFLVGVVYQTIVPVAPGAFALRNRPDVFEQSDARLSPVFHEGDILKASRFDYTVDLFFLSRRILHTLPERFDLVRVNSPAEDPQTVLVLGLPGEVVELENGLLWIDGMAVYEPPIAFALDGRLELTRVDDYSFLVAATSLGSISRLEVIPLESIIGKVSALF